MLWAVFTSKPSSHLWQPLDYSAGVFVYFRAAGCSGPSVWRRRFSQVAVYFCELLRTAALHRVTPLSCPPYAEPDVICPPSYEHEVNKTLGHRKSRASDMSGAEISLTSGGVSSMEAVSRALQPCSSCSPPWSQCVRSLLKLELN